MQADALNCPNCAAAVSSDRTRCEFCKSRLKTVACPSCLGVMFLGSKFCSHCGERSVDAEILLEENAGQCPRCKIELQSLKIGSTSMRECLRCGGFWMGVETFESLCGDKEEQSAVINYSGSKPRELNSLPAISYVPCPDCKQLMNRSNFARSSGVIVDLCKEHGVWFDADELPKIIDFIDEGGLARSREKEKVALEEERGRLRDEQRRLAAMERRSGGGRYGDDQPGAGFGGVVAALFDL
ncbi:MAG TPA: zinc ribbon domain-containing protein [Pyrinomonadaceae bacterium]|nr:zinc ribbon domain-containing protein [Pyrinomonadaceae bacterium]